MRRLAAFFACLASLVIPGAGLIFIGRYFLAIFIQASLFLLFTLLCWSRWAFEPLGIKISLVFILIIYSISPIIIIRTHILEVTPKFKVRNLFFCTIFIFSSLAAAVSLFLAKQKVLGVQLNFIPSGSMEPTLRTGDFILVDTWQIQSRTPTVGDIITFKRKDNDALMVKRVTKVDVDNDHQLSYFVEGDNKDFSTDSRSFGNIELENTEGIVKLVLFSIDQQLALRRERLLISL